MIKEEESGLNMREKMEDVMEEKESKKYKWGRGRKLKRKKNWKSEDK